MSLAGHLPGSRCTRTLDTPDASEEGEARPGLGRVPVLRGRCGPSGAPRLGSPERTSRRRSRGSGFHGRRVLLFGVPQTLPLWFSECPSGVGAVGRWRTGPEFPPRVSWPQGCVGRRRGRFGMTRTPSTLLRPEVRVWSGPVPSTRRRVCPSFFSSGLHRGSRVAPERIGESPLQFILFPFRLSLFRGPPLVRRSETTTLKSTRAEVW